MPFQSQPTFIKISGYSSVTAPLGGNRHTNQAATHKLHSLFDEKTNHNCFSSPILILQAVMNCFPCFSSANSGGKMKKQIRLTPKTVRYGFAGIDSNKSVGEYRNK